MPRYPDMIDLARLNGMSRADFTQVLGDVFEHSPWVPERAWATRPFATVGELHAAMVNEVNRASRDEQVTLLRAHPELAGKETDAGTLTEHSTAEQKGAGLVNLTAEEKSRIARLNAAYRDKFGFPFIIAVREHTKSSIFAELERRLGNDHETELRGCLDQVYTITRLRLENLVRA